MTPIELLSDLVRIPGPPGQENRVLEYLAERVSQLGLTSTSDAKGNLLVKLGTAEKPKIVVTAHMDEIAMIVRRIEPDGQLVVGALGGLFPWKLGEGPVQVLSPTRDIDGVLSFGSIHTADPSSTVRKLDSGSLNWDMVRVFTGQTKDQLESLGVRPGTRVVVGKQSRDLFTFGEYVSGHFLDDRADLVAWLLVLNALKDSGVEAVFVASAAEEVGGEGALFVMQELRPDVCIALELSPSVTDAPVELSAAPSIWVNDSYSAMSAADGDLLASISLEKRIPIQFQALSRGGSDASCAASHGLCGRPITLGIPMMNSHGYEIMHRDAMDQLAALTIELIKRL